MRMLLLITLLMLTGCATPLTKYERQEQDAIDRENWVMCQLAYKQANKVMISHHDHKRGPHRDHEIRDDLRDNACRLAVGRRHWITR